MVKNEQVLTLLKATGFVLAVFSSGLLAAAQKKHSINSRNFSRFSAIAAEVRYIIMLLNSFQVYFFTFRTLIKLQIKREISV